MKKIYNLAGMAVLGLMLNAQNTNAQLVSDFEFANLDPETYWDGSDLTGSNNTTNYTTVFESGDAGFLNAWDVTWGLPGYWKDGFAISTHTDSTTSGSGNLLSAKAASGNNASLTYLVGQNGAAMEFLNTAADTSVSGIYLTNNTYAANSMRDGDGFAKKFGGASGNDPDWFRVTIKGFDSNGDLLSDSVDFYLADYRDANNANDYILTDWTFVDLASLGNVKGLVFFLNSSDSGSWGMNTPAFFCLDDVLSHGSSLVDFEDLGFSTADSAWDGSDLSGTPNDPNFVSWVSDGDAEFFNSFSTSWGGYWNSGFAISNMTDSITSGSGNLYSAKAAQGALGSTHYAVVQNGANMRLTGNAANTVANGVYITNSTFAYNSMRDGDNFAKKFGGTSGDDPDWLKLTIRGYNNGNLNADTIAFYLADFRDADNSKDYILKDWAYVDLSGLGVVDSITFSMSSSDMSPWGMNTPSFFALDNFNDISTSTNEVTNLVANVYPNPAQNQIAIQSASGMVELVQIFDVRGALQLTATQVTNHSVINIENLESGVYFVTYSENGATYTQRLIVQ